MIQFNLLPDVKQEFIKARRLKRLISVISSIVAGVALVIFIFLLVLVDFIQKGQISSLSKNITTTTSQIGSTANLSKILTVQNQLQSLPALDNAKPAASRLFTYLTQITPCQVSINSINVSVTANTISLGGSANSLADINTFVDTLKFTTYSTGSGASKNAFTSVVLSSYGVPTAGSAVSGATYTITADFAPALFISTDNTKLTVPQLVTTRSDLDQPSSPFTQTQVTATTQQCGS